MPGPIRVLILEDRPDDADLALAHLRAAGFVLQWQRVDNERDFVAHLDPSLDFILADYRLPQFDGLKALDLVKRRGLDIPFIIVSGKIGEEAAVAAMRNGAHDYVLKRSLTRLAASVERELRAHADRRAAEAARNEYMGRLRSIFESVLDAVVTIDIKGRITDWNPQAESMFGWPKSEAVGRLLADTIIPEQYREAHRRGLARLDATAQGPILGRRLEVEALHRDGHEFQIELSIAANRVAGQDVFSGFMRDITEAKRAQLALRASEERYRRIVETAFEGIWIIDPDDKTTFANRRMAEMLGYTVDEMLGKPVVDFMDAEARASFQGNPDRRKGFEPDHDFRFVRKDGSELRTLLEASPSLDEAGSYLGSLAMVTDITERRRAEEALRHQTFHDTITGLPNRARLTEQLTQAIEVARTANRPLALLMLDVDHFKEVNEAFGHQAGDRVLQHIGSRLASVLRDIDVVARFGGDEFAVLVPGADHDEATAVGARLLESFDRPVEVEDQFLDVAASIGIAMFPGDGLSADALLRRADIALFVAKRSRGCYVSYAPEQENQGASRLALMAELRRAIHEDQLFLHYQPLVSLRDGTLQGVEALVRWQHPERGLVPPAEFIPFAEKTRLIQPLTRWVMRSALRQSQLWNVGGRAIPIAVNIAMRDLVDPEFPQAVAAALQEVGLPPAGLHLEITESVIMTDPERVIETLGRLRKLGVRLAVDDFGTGYSSLAYLHRLPVDQLKIDRSFVFQMTGASSGANIVRAAVELGHSLRLETVAEGVEDERTWDLLAALGCDTAQGYYVSRPVPAEELLPWLAGWEAARRGSGKDVDRQAAA